MCVYVWEWLSDVYVCVYGVGCVIFACVYIWGWLCNFWVCARVGVAEFIQSTHVCVYMWA